MDNFIYKTSHTLVVDETNVKMYGVKVYIWFIIDAVLQSILGYQVSNHRGIGVLYSRHPYDV